MKKFFRPIDVLLVEDNIGDVRLTEEALKETQLKLNLHVVSDGVEAMEFLHHQNKYINSPIPDMIILDLNLPRKDGRQVLKEIKSDPDLLRIPVTVLTTSQSEEDILQSYNLHTNCYLTKPIDLEQFVNVVKALESFWFTVASLPPK